LAFRTLHIPLPFFLQSLSFLSHWLILLLLLFTRLYAPCEKCREEEENRSSIHRLLLLLESNQFPPLDFFRQQANRQSSIDYRGLHQQS
ncbi:hypothetical protein PFISCL1PPCAC_21789, partial [Pristionchus fissidentatus]